jgi:Uma2 family endonuclease
VGSSATLSGSDPGTFTSSNTPATALREALSMATLVRPPEQQVVLHNVSWETYEHLLADHLDSSAPRFTYDQGELEILSPSAEHERDNRSLALLVEDITMEWSIEVSNVGSMTFKRNDLQRGFEPASSFYIQNESLVRGRAQIDLTVDPPPDLVIEIEVSRSVVAKLPIYASLGIPEVWRSDGDRVAILALQGGGNEAEAVSAALAPLTTDLLSRFLRESRTLKRTEWRRQVRAWANEIAR